MTLPQHIRTRSEIGLEWLVRLRWWAAVGEASAAASALIWGSPFVFGLVLALALFTAASNVALMLAQSRWPEVAPSAARGTILLDVATLTAALALAGGPANPFSIIYLVHVSLAAVLLNATWAWITAASTVGCYALLFLLVPIAQVGETAEHALHDAGTAFGAHLWGMFGAFTIAAVLVAHFVLRLTRALASREVELSRVREEAARSERLASLMALAAGTAHEMGTPLATVALVARELEHAAGQPLEPGRVVEDARLIRAQVERCRALIEQLGSCAGELSGEAPVRLSLQAVVDDLRAGLPPRSGARLQVRVDPAADHVTVPARALLQVLGNLVHNALDATDEARSVDLTVHRHTAVVVFEVRDEGCGMTGDQLARAREPFYTTKGASLGLGLFLAERFAQQIGGRLELHSAAGSGTTARLEVPA